jgi:repressor LexA
MEIERITPKNKSQAVSLTPKEKKVLEFIELYVQQNGLAPTFLEIKEHFQFASFNSVQRYLKQLQKKEYIHMPGGNQKRALTILKPSSSILKNLNLPSINQDGFTHHTTHVEKGASLGVPPYSESLSLPLLGKVAAGRPIEAIQHDTYIEVPPSLVRSPNTSFALTVSGSSMIEDGILDGDTILVQKQDYANNGEIVVALIENEATVKRIYFDKSSKPKSHLSLKTFDEHDQEFNSTLEKPPQVELRPSNSDMNTMWFDAHKVSIEGIVVGLSRKF